MISPETIAEYKRHGERLHDQGLVVTSAAILALLVERESLISLLSEVRDESAEVPNMQTRKKYVTIQMTPETWGKLKEQGQ